MYRTTKEQRKNRERIEAWLRGEPFKENSGRAEWMLQNGGGGWGTGSW